MANDYEPDYERADGLPEARQAQAEREYYEGQPSGIDVMNRCGVGMLGAQVRILMPTHRMSAAEARVHAAWLVAVAEAIDPDGTPFEEILVAVRNT